VLLSPFFLYTICFTAGIIWAHTPYTIGLQIVFFTFTTCFFYYAIKKNKRHSAIFSLFLTFFFISGYGYYRWYIYTWNTLVAKATEKKYRFCGIITEQKITESKILRITLQCYLPKIFANKSIFIYVKNQDFTVSYEPGDFISIYAKLCPTIKTNFNEYLIKEKIIGTLFTKSTLIKLSQEKSILGRIIYAKNSLRLVATSAMSTLTKQLFELLFLGYKAESKITEVDLQFKQWGISHFLARSGLHLNFLIALANSLLIYIPFQWCLKQLIILVIVFLYCLFTWTTIPIMRTFMLFFFIKLFLCMKHQYDAFNIICIVWILFLLLNPFYLFFLDFQLTFILSGALTWLSKQPKTI
jgi:hypothetical protein